MPPSSASATRFQVELIKPSHYDDNGYVIQWLKAWIPSNSLASLYGLTCAADRSGVLGEGVRIEVNAYDETNTLVPVKRIIGRIQANGGRGLVCLVGVQSNQFPRAMDLARRFRAAGLQVVMGGFHISGSLAMLPGIPPELQEAMDLGVSLFAGEAEEHFADLLRAADDRRLEPLYNHMAELPDLQGKTMPYLPPEVARRYAPMPGTFDAGRGCPFLCSFCTIINVQGRKSRFRDPGDIERLLRANLAHGIRHYFITDDNFARNRNWEPIFDRIAALRRELGVKLNFTIQVDTMCHTLPGFVTKARAAGVSRVFIGLESGLPHLERLPVHLDLGLVVIFVPLNLLLFLLVSKLLINAFSFGERQRSVMLQREIETRLKAEEALQAANTELQHLATTDRLTGVWNRTHLEAILVVELARAERDHQPLSLLIIDVDHFKSINDTFGHLAGDAVLIELTRRIRAQVRLVDVLARWGGEEFVLLLPQCGAAQGLMLAEKLLALVADQPFPAVGRVTASFGLAQFQPAESFDSRLQRADGALYAAKQGGRNRICEARDQGS